jgi:carbon monoxide dehydrogenase subunit G
MTIAFTSTTLIDRPAEDVWRRLTDWEHAAEWLGVDSVGAEGPTAVGTRLRVHTRGKEQRSEITVLDPGRSVTLRSQQGGVTADYTYTVEPADTGSRLTLVADVGTRGVWTVAGPALRAVIRRSDQGQVHALARELAV